MPRTKKKDALPPLRATIAKRAEVRSTNNRPRKSKYDALARQVTALKADEMAVLEVPKGTAPEEYRIRIKNGLGYRLRGTGISTLIEYLGGRQIGISRTDI